MGCKERDIGKESKPKKKRKKKKEKRNVSKKWNVSNQFVIFQLSWTARISPFSHCRSLSLKRFGRAKFFPLLFTREDKSYRSRSVQKWKKICHKINKIVSVIIRNDSQNSHSITYIGYSEEKWSNVSDTSGKPCLQILKRRSKHLHLSFLVCLYICDFSILGEATWRITTPSLPPTLR